VEKYKKFQGSLEKLGEFSMVKVFFFPYGGGSAVSYLSWKKFLCKDLEIKPVELAGRGKRINDPPLDTIDAIIADIYPRISGEFEEGPYAFFGHSMGTILIYELVRKIQALKNREPFHIFFSGRFPPYEAGNEGTVHTLPNEEFIKKIMEHGGMSLEFIENQELLDILLPVLREDYKAVGTYCHQGEIVRVNCDISIMNGKEDQYVSGRDLTRWQEFTTGKCQFYEFDGGHFYINQWKKEITEIINNTLARQ
jgi:medium-chain acyl-[acyl-carrier-protein] hydrolase